MDREDIKIIGQGIVVALCLVLFTFSFVLLG